MIALIITLFLHLGVISDASEYDATEHHVPEGTEIIEDVFTV